MAWWLAWVNMLLYIKWSSTTCISLYDDTLSFNDKQMPKMSLSVLLCLSFYLSQHAPVSLIIMVMNPYWHVFSVLLAIEAKCVGPGFIIYTKKWAPMNERLRTTDSGPPARHLHCLHTKRNLRLKTNIFSPAEWSQHPVTAQEFHHLHQTVTVQFAGKETKL